MLLEILQNCLGQDTWVFESLTKEYKTKLFEEDKTIEGFG